MIVIVIIGILFAVLAIPIDKSEEKKEAEDVNIAENQQYNPSDYEDILEKRLEEILSQIDGVGCVEVMITMESSGREVVEKDLLIQQNYSSNGDEAADNALTREETTIYSDTSYGSTPYVVQEIYPKVEGVLVVAEGGDNSYVILAITDAIQALFGVDVHKIKIVKMNTN